MYNFGYNSGSTAGEEEVVLCDGSAAIQNHPILLHAEQLLILIHNVECVSIVRHFVF